MRGSQAASGKVDRPCNSALHQKMDVPLREKGTYRFDRFQLDPLRRTLSRGDERIVLHGRPFDTLAYLVQHHDRVVTRAELIAAVWPDRVVDENNLGQAIA